MFKICIVFKISIRRDGGSPCRKRKKEESSAATGSFSGFVCGYLEVGSPGLGRKLTRPEHYEALKGQKVRAKLIRPNADGVRELSGILTGREGSTVTLETENGPVTFEVNAASGVQLCDDEDLFN